MDRNQFNPDTESLKEVIENRFTMPQGINPFEFALTIMPNLHSPEPEMRDKLTYSIMVELLMRNLLSKHQTAKLLRLSISDDYLFYKIGEVGTGSVFTRSFSVLIIAGILEIDANDSKLPFEEVKYAMENVITYSYNEQDHRGYVDEKGRAHSVAHTADALDACAQHPYITMDDRVKILREIRHLATLPYPLFNLEDDRLAYPVLRMILSDDGGGIDWTEWILQFEARHSAEKKDTLRLVNTGYYQLEEKVVR